MTTSDELQGLAVPGRTAIVHDRFIIRGGGERLVLSLARHLASLLCFGYQTEGGALAAAQLQGVEVRDLKARSNIFGWHTLKFIYGFYSQTQFLKNFSSVIYSGILAPIAIRNHRMGRNVYYCHTPPRFVYDQYEFHMNQLEQWKQPLMSTYVAFLKRVYELSVAQMDCVVVNSAHVQERVSRYLGLPSVVVYPPCDTSRFVWQGQGDYYLSTARLEPLKRVERIVEAFVAMPERKLIVLSGGSQLLKLRSLASRAANITFTGWVDDLTLLRLMGNCIATLYMPIEEDFGMSPVESMSCGKPVIGVQEGGMIETVVDGETGILLRPNPTVSDVIGAVRALPLERALAMRQACQKRAELFTEQKFVEKMRWIIGGECTASESGH